MRSDWSPPFKTLSTETQKAIVELAKFAHRNISDTLVHSDDGLLLHCRSSSRLNLSLSGIRTLRQIQSDNTIIIKPADRDSAVVVMDKTFYKAEALPNLIIHCITAV